MTDGDHDVEKTFDAANGGSDIDIGCHDHDQRASYLPHQNRSECELRPEIRGGGPIPSSYFEKFQDYKKS